MNDRSKPWPKLLSPLLSLALAASPILAAGPPQDAFPLWPEGAMPDVPADGSAHGVPSLTPYWPTPEKATGAAMIVCPGGGYSGLSDHEGEAYARWLAERGVAGIVLKYRLGSGGYRHPAMMHDIQRAVRVVRAHAEEWGLDPARIGVMGSSAGGHLASTALVHFDAGDASAADPVERVSCRPDLGVLCYPVISMGKLAHEGSRLNLLGAEPAPESVAFLSSELHVTRDTPPCFLWHTRDDEAVSVRNSLVFADALLAQGVPYDLHVYQTGHHGVGLGVGRYEPGQTDPATLLPWTHDLDYWLRLQGFVK